MVGGPVDVTGWGLTAWIIDSGIDVDHPDLNVDVSRGANFVSKGKSTIDDGNGHGTHVAGTLAAIDNDIDVVGVAAGATVVPVRVLHNSNWATYDDMIAGIDYVAAMAQPGDVANMSIWAHEHVESLHQATIGLAEVIPFVVIAGNDGDDINLSPSEPAHVEHANLYTVSAVDFNGEFTDFSNYGDSNSDDCSAKDPYPCAAVDIAAPGQDVTSLKPGGGLATWNGTSMAAPHVAGVILLLGGNAPTTEGMAVNDPDGQPDPIVKYTP
jgi:subtilisin family serine protease